MYYSEKRQTSTIYKPLFTYVSCNVLVEIIFLSLTDVCALEHVNVTYIADKHTIINFSTNISPLC